MSAASSPMPTSWGALLERHALPLGGWLTFGRGHGFPGRWWGRCVGLGIVAACLVARIAVRGPGGD
jgi:hypothetical protein